jgi:hypothetical protein
MRRFFMQYCSFSFYNSGFDFLLKEFQATRKLKNVEIEATVNDILIARGF